MLSAAFAPTHVVFCPLASLYWPSHLSLNDSLSKKSFAYAPLHFPDHTVNRHRCNCLPSQHIRNPCRSCSLLNPSMKTVAGTLRAFLKRKMYSHLCLWSLFLVAWTTSLSYLHLLQGTSPQTWSFIPSRAPIHTQSFQPRVSIKILRKDHISHNCLIRTFFII